MDDVKLALLGDRAAQERITARGELLPCAHCGGTQIKICAQSRQSSYGSAEPYLIEQAADVIAELLSRCTRLEEAREHANEACAKWEARAESAEKQRDAAISDLETAMAYGGTYNCQFCRNAQCLVRGGTKPCLPKWRGTKEE